MHSGCRVALALSVVGVSVQAVIPAEEVRGVVEPWAEEVRGVVEVRGRRRRV